MERELAHIERIHDIKPIKGADNIDKAKVLGWDLIVKKGEFQEDDLCVFFEVDSKLPRADWSEFLEKRDYKVKIYKLGKFGVWSEGLALPISSIPQLNGKALTEGQGVTELLGVVYSVQEDNIRKKGDPDAKYKSMSARNKKLFQKKPFRWLMKRTWGKKLLFFFFGRKKDSPKGFPDWIKKSDELKVENMPWILGNGKVYDYSEKLDGTSSSYGLKRLKKGKNKYEFFVCSRNVRLNDPEQETYHEQTKQRQQQKYNIYWFNAFKYNIQEHLTKYMNAHPELDWVYIQGESVGSVQGNPYKLTEDDLYVFNFVTNTEGRWPSPKGKELIESWGMKWVPLLGTATIPADMEELKLFADGKSVINPKVDREGLVYRGLDGQESFKNVSRKYLLKHQQ